MNDDDKYLSDDLDQCLADLDHMIKRSAKLEKKERAAVVQEFVDGGLPYLRSLVAMCEYNKKTLAAALENLKSQI